MQSSKYIEIDDAVFQSKIRKLATRFKIDEKKFVSEQGALFLNDIGRFVPPYAAFPSGNSKLMGTPKDNLAGKMAIKYDLEKIFTVPKNEWVFRWAVDKFKGKEIKKGKEIIGAGTIISLDGMKKFHDFNRKQKIYNIRTKGCGHCQGIHCNGSFETRSNKENTCLDYKANHKRQSSWKCQNCKTGGRLDCNIKFKGIWIAARRRQNVKHN